MIHWPSNKAFRQRTLKVRSAEHVVTSYNSVSKIRRKLRMFLLRSGLISRAVRWTVVKTVKLNEERGFHFGLRSLRELRLYPDKWKQTAVTLTMPLHSYCWMTDGKRATNWNTFRLWRKNTWWWGFHRKHSDGLLAGTLSRVVSRPVSRGVVSWISTVAAILPAAASKLRRRHFRIDPRLPSHRQHS